MKWLFAIVILFSLQIEPVQAAGMEEPLDLLWEEAQEYGISSQTSLEEGTSTLLHVIQEEMAGMWRHGLRTAAKLLAVVLVCSLAQQMERSELRQGMDVTQMAGALAIAALALGDVNAMIGLGRECVGRMELFSRVLLPAMATVCAATGNITGGAVRQSITVFFSQMMVLAMDRLLIPMVYYYVAVSCAQAVLGNGGLSRLASLIKGAITFFLTGMLLVFVGYLTASGAIAGTVDAAKVKAAKMAISRAVPVVGSILSDASEAILAGAGMLKGTVGIVGLLVVLAICITPFLHLGMQYVIYKGTCALCATVADPKLCGLIDAIGGAFGLVLGMTGAAALLLMVSMVSAVSVVVR